MASSALERFVPDIFYEIIAYFFSGGLFIALGSLAMVEPDVLKRIAIYVFSLGLPVQIGLVVFAGVLTYSYGQLASTLSAPFVADPVGKIVKKISRWTSPDFRIDFSDTVKAYGLSDKLPTSKINNKWTLMFYLNVKVPEIGKDIMKRYAREKLARINAFNMFLLIVLAILSLIGERFQLGQRLGLSAVLRAADPLWLVLYIVLIAVYSYEYYKRKCWNNDLLIKVMPAANAIP